MPRYQSGWICAPFTVVVGIRWKPIPQGANRTKFCRYSRRLPLEVFHRIRAGRPQYDVV